MSMMIPAPPEAPTSTGGSSSKGASGGYSGVPNRFGYYKVPIGFGRPTGDASRDYDYVLGLTMHTGRFEFRNKSDGDSGKLVAKSHVARHELSDPDGDEGTILTKRLRGSIFYWGGKFNNFAKRCQSDSFLADPTYIDAQDNLTDEQKAEFKQDRPRIRGLWQVPFRASNNRDTDVIGYYEPHGMNKLPIQLPNGVTVEANEGIACKDCGLCWNTALTREDPYKNQKGKLEYSVFMIVTGVGAKDLENPFPIELKFGNVNVSSVHRLLYQMYQANPEGEYSDNVVELVLKPILDRNGDQVPYSFEVEGEIKGETPDGVRALIDQVHDLHAYKPSGMAAPASSGRKSSKSDDDVSFSQLDDIPF